MASPTLSLYLDGDLSIQLHHKGQSGSTPTLKIQMHDNSFGATMLLPGYNASNKTLSLPLALQGDLLALYDTASQTKIPTPSNPDPAPLQELVVEAGAPNRWLNLKLDPSDAFWADLLRPSHTYEIRWANAPRAHRRPEQQQEQQEQQKQNDQGQGQGQNSPENEDEDEAPVRLLPRPIKLTVLDPSTAPPNLSLSLTPTNQICHLTGTPRFGLTLRLTLPSSSQSQSQSQPHPHKDKPLTFCLAQTPLRALHSLEEIARVVDTDTEEEVEWPYSIGCFEDAQGGGFPSDDAFEEVVPGGTYERTFWLARFDRETANGGELESLESGKRYQGRVGEELLASFTKWRWGGKGEVLSGGKAEKEERWRAGSGGVLLEVSEPFVFETVE